MKGFLSYLSAFAILVAHSTASTFSVNQPNDAGDGVCDTAGCTLREAIDAANAHLGADTIVFDIPSDGLQTITLTSNFPAITDSVTIDGYTQPGASPNTEAVGNNAVLRVEVNATALSTLS